MSEDDYDLEITYPCYFLYGEDGGLECNDVDGHLCLCLFTSKENVQRFFQFLHPHVEFLMATVDQCADRGGLIARLKLGEAEMAAAGVHHIVVDPFPDRPVIYATVREFIENLPE